MKEKSKKNMSEFVTIETQWPEEGGLYYLRVSEIIGLQILPCNDAEWDVVMVTFKEKYFLYSGKDREIAAIIYSKAQSAIANYMNNKLEKN